METQDKAKTYDEVLKKARMFYKDEHVDNEVNSLLEVLFPELKESEDERIRKSLIKAFGSIGKKEWGGVNVKNAIAWLEKQSGLKQETNYPKFDFDDILAIECCMETADKVTEDKKLYEKLKSLHSRLHDAYWIGKQSEQKPTDKVEPKFHEGEWVVFNNHHDSVYQIEKIENYEYTLRHFLGGSMPLPFSHEDMIRAWTIQDAKDGDVLVCEDFGYISLMLFKSFSNGRISLYCWHNSQTNNFHINTDTALRKDANIFPATKEQKEILFMAMADAGYTFDFEKKKLKKIVAPKFNIGDTMRTLQEAADNITSGLPVVVSIDEEYYHCNNELIAIKDQDNYEYPPMNRRQKPAWSEEDEVILDEIIDFFENGTVKLQHDLSLYASWLKSLKGRVGCEANCTTTKEWKPSDEQMDALQYVCRNLNPPLSDKLGWDSLKTLELLYKILKKLY